MTPFPAAGAAAPVRALLTGWFSFLHGEATAGDVLALESVSAALAAAGLGYDVAWSPVFRPGGLRLDDARPGQYSHLIFICGPAHGEQVAALHRHFAGCRRIAVGVSVIDPADPAVTGFQVVLARDGNRSQPVRDLAAAAVSAATASAIPVAGLALATGQGEYGPRRRHQLVADGLTRWLGSKSCAPVPLETRLDIHDWRLCSTPGAFLSLLTRLDLVVTTRLHGLALALSAGVPAIAVRPGRRRRQSHRAGRRLGLALRAARRAGRGEPPARRALGLVPVCGRTRRGPRRVGSGGPGRRVAAGAAGRGDPRPGPPPLSGRAAAAEGPAADAASGPAGGQRGTRYAASTRSSAWATSSARPGAVPPVSSPAGSVAGMGWRTWPQSLHSISPSRRTSAPPPQTEQRSRSRGPVAPDWQSGQMSTWRSLRTPRFQGLAPRSGSAWRAPQR